MPPSCPTNGLDYSSGGVQDRALGEAMLGTWMAPATFMIDKGGGSLLSTFHHTHLCLLGHSNLTKGEELLI